MSEEIATAWYVVHTQTGHEEKVRKKILLDVETHQFGDRIFQALVPTEEVREVKQNKEIRHQRKFFPGYVLVEMKMTSEAYWLTPAANRNTWLNLNVAKVFALPKVRLNISLG